jgi:hypothetical protein
MYGTKVNRMRTTMGMRMLRTIRFCSAWIDKLGAPNVVSHVEYAYVVDYRKKLKDEDKLKYYCTVDVE